MFLAGARGSAAEGPKGMDVGGLMTVPSNCDEKAGISSR
jgi:hypothetical protein